MREMGGRLKSEDQRLFSRVMHGALFSPVPRRFAEACG